MRRVLAWLAAVVLIAGVVPARAQLAAAAGNAKQAGVYIVRMAEPPVVAYAGGISGYPATKPDKGKKIDPNDPKVTRYASYLTARHDAALQAVGAQRKLYSYRYAFNGFAAELTAAQVERLQRDPNIIAVAADTLAHPETNRTPSFLGLDAPGGLWEQLGGTAGAGEGIVIGMVDSGIWPENPSFSDRNADGKLLFHQIPGWHGKCTPGEAMPASDCNQKLIGAQWFNQGWGGNGGTKAAFPYEYMSARDADGHGSHTASTAAGNYGVPVTVEGIDLGRISGMAPRARIATYKVCWGNGEEGGCFSSDSVAAIDQAVADGVDVINYSISGSLASFLDPVEVAFLFAANAGVFVAASAGNSGPGAATVAHNSPWLTTVAAGTQDRYNSATLTLGNGATYTGPSLGSGTPMLPIVTGAAAALAGADLGEAALCYPGTLDPAVAAGKVVLCDRGVIARVDKSLAVRDAGGAGMILANTSPSSLNADLHYVPTIHVDEVAGAAIKAHLSSRPAPTGTISASAVTVEEAPDVAAFSSRGPARAGAGDLLKPDLMAPGVDILAAVSPAGSGGRNWDFYSGTSMSSPHVAGLAALLKHRHPDWSPAAVKSALMTSAGQSTNMGNPIPGNPFAYGAGQVRPTGAADPGLVYDAGWIDWLGFLCGTGQLKASYCPAIGIDPSNLNYPSIAIGDLAGVQTVHRTVRNVGAAAATYSVAVDAPAGIAVSVSPSSLTLAPGASAGYQVTFTRTSAPLNGYAFGALTWSDGVHAVRSPLAIRPVAIAAPGAISGRGASGSISFPVKFGFNGDYAVVARGLVPATTFQSTVADDPNDSFSPGGPGVVSYSVAVPAGVRYARFSLFNDATDGNDDLDLYVYRGATLVGASGGGTADEEVNLLNPAADTYTVYVHGWQTDGPDANFTLFTWQLTDGDAGNMSVSAPPTATVGATGTIGVSWSGLSPGVRYLGAITHHSEAAPATFNSSRVGLTMVRIDS